MDIPSPLRRAGDERVALSNEPLKQLDAEGVSLWLDGTDRRHLSSGELEVLVRDFGIIGASCPPIRPHRAVESLDYREQLRELAAFGMNADEAARTLTAYDVRAVCDALGPVWRRSKGAEGQVCAPVVHTLDTRATLGEARWLRWAVDRPNLLIQFPADPVGLSAACDCLAQGIGATVGPVFSEEQHEEAVEALLQGLERAEAAGLALSRLGSAVLVPVAEVDTVVQSLLASHGGTGRSLGRRIGVALARLMFTAYEECLDSRRWRRLAAAGARPPRLVWAIDRASAARLTGGLVAAGTVQSLTSGALDLLTHTAVLLEGDTLSGRAPSARDDLGLLAHLGVSWKRSARDLLERAPLEHQRSWNELVEAVATVLEGTDH
ncbi:transaldolase family protein [Streptomyces sp. NPDC050546]|uniref:transaldolase family protein n=1 Tax=Streptomyces sp. NPDC050546 TaxID=3365628 RepID=UPI0037945252